MNPLTHPLKLLLLTTLREGKAEKHPTWVTALVSNDGSDLDSDFYIKQSRDPSQCFPQHIILDGSAALREVFKSLTFVEFPTIDVYQKNDVPSLKSSRLSLDESTQKRRKMELETAKRGALHALVQYDTDSDSSDQIQQDALAAINDYSDGNSDERILSESRKR